MCGNNLKLKLRRGNYLPGIYKGDRLQDEILRVIFLEQLDMMLEGLQSDHAEDGRNCFRERS